MLNEETIVEQLQHQGLVKLSKIRKGKLVVLTTGVFDIFHLGHLSLFDAANRMGDILVVGVNSDASVRRLGKGIDRPIHCVKDRIKILASLKIVDVVVPFGEDTPTELIEIIRPDVFVKGGDYSVDQLPEAGAVLSNGGTIAIVPLLEGHSTTKLIELSKKS